MDLLLLGSVAAMGVSLVVLWFAGGRVVEYALKVSQAFNVTTFFVGFVILAMAADLPEITVAITSALRGISEVSVGDLIGANFCDVALVTGVTAMVAGSIDVGLQERRRLLGLLAGTTVVMLAVFAIGTLFPIHGVFLISIYLVSIFLVWRKRKKTGDDEEQEALCKLYDEEGCTATTTGQKAILLAKLFTCLGLVLGSSALIVYFAETFAHHCGMSLEAVGATIVAIGTSLPELSLSLNALKRKEYALALGPTLGTVLEQCTLILGLLTVFSKQPVNLAPVQGASVFMFLAFIIVSYALVQQQIKRRVGAVLLTLFVCYLAYHCV